GQIAPAVPGVKEFALLRIVIKLVRFVFVCLVLLAIAGGGVVGLTIWYFVPIGVIPKRVVAAFLSAEDKNFYSHHGVDPVSMFRAALTDVGRWHSKRRPVGASTITQQVAKNMLLTNELSINRKIKEILLATRIDEALSKDRILELYLNEIYLGSGAYGVEAAALLYFNKSLDRLSLGGGAFLGRFPNAPNHH